MTAVFSIGLRPFPLPAFFPGQMQAAKVHALELRLLHVSVTFAQPRSGSHQLLAHNTSIHVLLFP